MEKIRGYANYGVLAHEKKPVFTISNTHAHTTVSEEIEITLPDKWGVGEDRLGRKLIITPDGEKYIADDIISSYGENPALNWYDGGKEHRIILVWEEV